MRLSTTCILMALSAAALSACATPDKDRARGIAKYDGDARLGEQVDKICFASGIDGFGETTRNTVIVREGVRDNYLVEVYGGCINLEGAQSIGLDSRQGCVRKGDNLIVSESLFVNDNVGIGPQSCAIKSIYKWNKDATEQAEAETEA